MSTATVPLPTAPPPAAWTPLPEIVNYMRAGQRILLTELSWEDYEHFLNWRQENGRGFRMTYDHGRLEIMTLSSRHERLRKVLALIVEAWLEVTGGEYIPSGQLTHARKDLDRGFEPDERYYVENWQKVTGLRELDFTKDPPPDFTIEVEASRSVLDRLPVLAAFKIPEVWRYDGDKLTVLLLQSNGEYQEAPASRAIPDFPFADAPRFLALVNDPAFGFAEIGRRFREWVRALPAAPNT